MDIITGFVGVKHITSEQDRDINIGIFGEKSYVLKTGTMMELEISSNNEVKIRDGVIIHQGCAASIKKNTYDSVTIINGSQGMKRIDLIVARYERNQDTEVESMTLVALQGTPVEANPVAPEYVQGDIQAGDTVVDMPMYEVVLDGLNIVETRKVFETAMDIETLNSNIAGMFSLVDGEDSASVNFSAETTWKTISLPAGRYFVVLRLQLRNTVNNNRHYLAGYLTGASGVTPIADIYSGVNNFSNTACAVLDVPNSGNIRLAYYTPTACGLGYHIYRIA